MTTFVALSYSEISLQPLASQGSETGATANQAVTSFLPLETSAYANAPPQGAAVSFRPLISWGANFAYSWSAASMLPMETQASSGEIAPSYAVSQTSFSYLTSFGLLLVGGIGGGDNSFEPLQLIAADHPYGEARVAFQPMAANASVNYPVDGWLDTTWAGTYVFAAEGSPLAANAFEGTMPFTFRAFGGANGAAVMPKPTVTGHGIVPAIGRATLTMPLPTVLSTGMGGSYGRSTTVLPTPYPVVGFSGAVLSVTLQDGYVLVASGTAGAVGRAVLELPLYDLTASGYDNEFGIAEVEMPMLVPTPSGVAILVSPRARLVAMGTAVVAVDYEAYVATVPDSSSQESKPEEPHTYAVTRYYNYPFNQIVRIGRRYFGVADDGLYLLEGTTDNGAAIPWAWRMCKTNFGSHNHKSVGSVYLGGRLDGGVKYKVVVGENTEYAYTHVTPRDAQPQNYREFFGKGIKATYFAFELYDNAGRYMEVDNCEFEVAELKRAI